MAHLFNLLGRVAFAALFLLSAYNKFNDFDGAVAVRGAAPCGTRVQHVTPTPHRLHAALPFAARCWRHVARH